MGTFWSPADFFEVSQATLMKLLSNYRETVVGPSYREVKDLLPCRF